MQNFEYFTPTKVVFGRGTENQVGALVAAQNAKKVLLHFGGGSAEASGLLGRVRASLKAAGVDFVELGGALPNPHLSLVYEGIELGKKEGVDFILAVGGGSAIDSAKAIGYGLANEGDVWELYLGKRKPTGCLPVGTVLTIAAAGSEMSDSSVISNTETGQKIGLSSVFGRPVFAVMNPELTITLPAYQTAAGCADILMHTMERYFNREAPPMQTTDALAEGLLRTVMDNAKTLLRTPDNYEARAEVMWAGALSHNGLTACGNGPGDWATHQLGHELSARYGMTHGAALAALWGSWARYVYKEDAARFARFAVQVLGLEEEDSDEATALAGIEEMEGFFWGIEMPTSLAEAEIAPTEKELALLAKGCSRNGSRTVGSFKVLAESDMEAIYRMAMGSPE